MNLRRVVALLITAYSVVALTMVAVIDPAGESGGEWTHVAASLLAVSLGLFLTIKRPENAIGVLITVAGAALVTLGATNILIPIATERQAWDQAIFVTQVSDLAWVAMFVSVLVLLQVARGWLDVVEETMEPARLGVWVKSR